MNARQPRAPTRPAWISTSRHLAALVAALGTLASAQPTPLRFEQIYAHAGVRGLAFTAQAQALDGQEVVMEGFVAPGEEGELPALLVLTPTPLRECPYCVEAADWPNEVEGMWRYVLVSLPTGTAIPVPGSRVRVTGRLSLGNRADAPTNVATPLHLAAVELTALD